MIIVASHATFGREGEPVHGSASELNTYLQYKRIQYIFLKHPIFGEYPSYVEKFDGKKITKSSYGIAKLPFPLRILQEQILNSYFIFSSRSVPVFIGVDPVNALTGVIWKKLGKVKKLIFYTADYAYQRFKNPILNNIYHVVDMLSRSNADQVWNVSSRIYEVRKKQGLSHSKNFFVPNTPEFRKTKRLSLSRINRYDLVWVGTLSTFIDFQTMFYGVKKLSSKFRKIRLLIIGGGEREGELKGLAEKLKLENKILFLGRKLHEEVLNILSRSGVGVALYTRDNPWTEFGDSMKVREYLASGLPVIVNDVPSTADDIKKANAGFVIKDIREFEQAAEKIFSNDQTYKQLRGNAIRLAKKYDFTRLMDEVLKF